MANSPAAVSIANVKMVGSMIVQRCLEAFLKERRRYWFRSLNHPHTELHDDVNVPWSSCLPVAFAPPGVSDIFDDDRRRSTPVLRLARCDHVNGIVRVEGRPSSLLRLLVSLLLLRLLTTDSRFMKTEVILRLLRSSELPPVELDDWRLLRLLCCEHRRELARIASDLPRRSRTSASASADGLLVRDVDFCVTGE